MSTLTINPKAQDSVLALDRSSYIGSSDIAAILGLSPWKTPYGVWEHKVYGIQDESTPDRDRILRRGARFEPVILDLLVDEEGVWIVERNQRYTDPVHPFLRAEIDAEAKDEITGEISNVEAKSVSPFAAKDWGEPGTDEVLLSDSTISPKHSLHSGLRGASTPLSLP